MFFPENHNRFPTCRELIPLHRFESPLWALCRCVLWDDSPNPIYGAPQWIFINTFDEEEPTIQVLHGRWGPYIKVEKTNYKIPKDTEAELLDRAQCLVIMENQPKKKGKAKTKATVKSKAKPKAKPKAKSKAKAKPNAKK